MYVCTHTHMIHMHTHMHTHTYTHTHIHIHTHTHKQWCLAKDASGHLYYYNEINPSMTCGELAALTEVWLHMSDAYM